jgi:hypothetical protein
VIVLGLAAVGLDIKLYTAKQPDEAHDKSHMNEHCQDEENHRGSALLIRRRVITPGTQGNFCVYRPYPENTII